MSENTIEDCRRRLAGLLEHVAEPASTGPSVCAENVSKNPSAGPRKEADVLKKSSSIPLRLQLLPSPPPKETERTKREGSKRGVKRLTEQEDVESLPDRAPTLKRRRTSRSASVPMQHSRFEDALHIPRRKSKESGGSSSSRRRSANSKDMDHDAHLSSRSVPSVQLPRSMQAPSSSSSSAKKLSPRKKPLERILDFARGKTSQLAKLDMSDKDDQLRRRTSLATFIGCGEYSHVNLAAYLRVLCAFHAKVVQAAVSDTSSVVESSNIDAIFCEPSDEEISRAMSLDGTLPKEQSIVSPPHIRSTIDVLQLVFRLWQKMSSGDESVMSGFLDSLYAGNAITAISSLSTSVLKLWQARNEVAKETVQARSELLEWSVRLLANITTFELSPVSRILNVQSARSPLLFLDYVTEKRNISLSQVLNIILEYVGSESATGRECRQAATDIFQVYLIRYHCHFQKESPQEEPWKTIVSASGGHVEHILQHKTFWPLTVTFAIQAVKKNQQQVDVWVAIAFLVSVLCEPIASRSLLETQTKARHALFEVFLRLLDRVGRDMLSFVAEIENTKNLYPGLPSALDLIRKLMSFAIVQREMISSRELGRRDDYLEAIENIISRAAKLVEGPVDSAKLMVLAHKASRGKVADELQEGLANGAGGERASSAGVESELEDPEAIRLNAIARYRALAFAAWLIGSLGKSMEDGSRDMSQMNGLHVLIASRFIGTRKLGKLWTDVVKIQCGLEHRIPTELRGALLRSSEPLLSGLERNYFSMVVEGIRSKLVSETKAKEGRGSPDNSSKLSSPEADVVVVSKNMSAGILFPDATKLKQLRSVACLTKGYRDFDDDPDILDHVIRAFKLESEETLARYDPESNLTTPWVRLNRRNAYIDGAREFLDKEDKILGHPCSCLPGNPTESNNGSQNRIACSNDSCENRLTKVECVPGECGAGSYCQNQRMQRLEYAKTKTVSFPNKGVGVVANEDIPAGAFIGEYQGEVISNQTFDNRKNTYRGERHFYFMTLTNKLVIDASRKSQFTRYVNHSCEPNSETQKWNAGGEPRVGIFAMRDIPKGEEVTFDYGARSLANDAVPCLCGAKACRGFLTTKKTQEGDADDVPIDVSGLANAADPTQNSVSQSEQGKKDELEMSAEEEEKVRQELTRRIEGAKEKLAMVEDLIARKVEASKSQNAFDESALNDKMKSVLADWESLVKRRQKVKSFTKANPSAKSEARIRIPRRPPQLQSTTQQSFLKSFIEQRKPKEGELKASTKPKLKNSVTTKGEVRRERAIPALPQERPSAPKRVDAQPIAPDTAARKPASTRKIMPFMPTSTKFKRPLLKPIIAKKMERKTTTEDTDSMDGYSTASSVEPIMDESDFDEAPDGLGACSDDEFVLAPPIEADHRDNVHRDGRVAREARQTFRAPRYRNGILTENGRPRENRNHVNRGEVERRRSPTDRHRIPEYHGGRNDRQTNVRASNSENHNRDVVHYSVGSQGIPKRDFNDSKSSRFRGSNRFGMEGLPEGRMRPRQDSLKGLRLEASPVMDKDRDSHPLPSRAGRRGNGYQNTLLRGPDAKARRGPPPSMDWNRESHRAHATGVEWTKDTNHPPITSFERSRDFNRISPAGLDRNRDSLGGPSPNSGWSKESKQGPTSGHGERRKFRGAPTSGLDGSLTSPSGTGRKADTHHRDSSSGIERSRNTNPGPSSGFDKGGREERRRLADTFKRDQLRPELDCERDRRAYIDRPLRAELIPKPFNSALDRDGRPEEGEGRVRNSHGEKGSGEGRDVSNRYDYTANNENNSLRGYELNPIRKEGVPPRLSEQDWMSADKSIIGNVHSEVQICENKQQSDRSIQRGESGAECPESEGTLRDSRKNNSESLKMDSFAQKEPTLKEVNSESTLKPVVTSAESERNADEGPQKIETNSFTAEKDESTRKSNVTGLPTKQGKLDPNHKELNNPRGNIVQDVAKDSKISVEKPVIGKERNVLSAGVNNGKASTELLRWDGTNDDKKVGSVGTNEKGTSGSKGGRMGLSSTASKVEVSNADGEEKNNEIARKGALSRIESTGDGIRRDFGSSGGMGGDEEKPNVVVEERSDVGGKFGKKITRFSPRSGGTHASRFKKVGPELGGTKRSRSDIGMKESKRMKRNSGNVESEGYLDSGKDGVAGTAGESRAGHEARYGREGVTGDRGKNVLERVGHKAGTRNLGRPGRDSSGMYRSSSGATARRQGEGTGGRRKRSKGGADRSPTRGDSGRMPRTEHWVRRSESRAGFDGRQKMNSGGNVHHSQQGGQGGGLETKRDLRSLLAKRDK